jgi:regulator of replication initiation timing
MKKGLEKGAKEEMRIRQGMGRVEDAIRKAMERKEQMKLEEEKVMEEVKLLEAEEADLKRLLEEKMMEEKDAQPEGMYFDFIPKPSRYI